MASLPSLIPSPFWFVPIQPPNAAVQAQPSVGSPKMFSSDAAVTLLAIQPVVAVSIGR